MNIKAGCKINLGLRVVRRRADGFHDIETVMMPVPGLFDEISVEPLSFLPPDGSSSFAFPSLTPLPYPSPLPVIPADSVLEVSGAVGAELDCEPENNLCMKALRLVQREFGIGEAHIKLHKNIPSGAGLGGGSADAAAVLKALNEEFVLELSGAQLEELAAQLGSDVPFFVRNTPQLCTGRGEEMTPVEVSLSGKWLAVLKPRDVSVSTSEAYSGVTPRLDAGYLPLPDILRRDLARWRGMLVNDFETSVFARYPAIARLKQMLYDAGAVYASMSGSGSAIFGIFGGDPRRAFNAIRDSIFVHVERLRG